MQSLKVHSELGADQKFGRQVAHCPDFMFVILVSGLYPAVQQAIAHGIGDGEEPVVACRNFRKLSQQVKQIVENVPLDFGRLKARADVSRHASTPF
jgi:hypothetical protein